MTTFDDCWRILCLARSTGGASFSAPGTMVYAVLTTGVFCRLGCRSRLPRRGNVRFFASSLAARKAGYRPCKRCQPDRISNHESERIERACRLIERSESTPSIDTQARAAGLSSSHFRKQFKAALGVTPKQYATAYRRGQLQRVLANGHSVTRAIHEAGYSSSSRVYENSDDLLGMSPGTYARGGEGELIAFGIERCSLGRVLVASTLRGICAVELGPSDRSLVRALERRFPHASREPLTRTGRSWLRAVVREVDQAAGKGNTSLPLDIRGTVFQQRVWSALRAVPPGQTITYSELARQLGAPGATRAVASACAANGLAVLVPCHRALRKDGGLGGYRWGLDRKQRLLQRERDYAAKSAKARR